MADFVFPWRLLGALLVEKGLIRASELEDALDEQRATGRRLGEILVSRGALDASALTRVLAEQYGIELPPSTSVATGSQETPAPWQPLGRLLVSRGTITQEALEAALDVQRRSGRRLGDVLVGDHGVSMLELAAALSQQQGLVVGGEETTSTSRCPDDSSYEVMEPRGAALFSTDSFLEATDFAFEYLGAESPRTLAIVRVRASDREQVWSYDADAPDDSPDLVERYGFQPNAWSGPPR
jgi:hypothetical protein